MLKHKFGITWIQRALFLIAVDVALVVFMEFSWMTSQSLTLGPFEQSLFCVVVLLR